MIRSKMELMDALSDAERKHQHHVRELKGAEARATELEVALRAADEVLLCGA